MLFTSFQNICARIDRMHCSAKARACPAWGAKIFSARGGSDVEAEIHHITVLHHVVLTLKTHESLVARRRDAAERDEIVIAHDLRADEAALKIRMNLARRLRRGRAARDRPRAALVLARRQECLESEQRERAVDEPVETAPNAPTP